MSGSREAFTHDHAAEIQRTRLLRAASEALEEVGYARMSVAEIVGRAGVSRKTFYETFADREDCFLALFEETIAQAAALLRAEYGEARDWRAGVRAALGRLLVVMESEPMLARLWVVESLKGGERVLARRAEVLAQLASSIGDGSAVRNGAREPPDVLAVGLVGGVLEVLHAHVVGSPGEPLTQLLGPLMYMIVLPYRGERAARQELSKPAPRPVRPEARRRRLRDPLDGLKMRMTYRTIRVLAAIDEQPGASNRAVGTAAGIADQGQASKLLNRLVRLELIENHGLGEKGAANAWRLTLRGEQLVRDTTTQRDATRLLATGGVE